MFESIAIIGRSCLLPGANTPQIFWQNILAGRDCLQEAAESGWGVNPLLFLNANASITGEATASIRTGMITGFEHIFNPDGFLLGKDEIKQFDVVFQWLCYCAREALHDAKLAVDHPALMQAGAVIGNLSYPTKTLIQYAQSVWLEAQGEACFNQPMLEAFRQMRTHPANRFMSGLPAIKMAKAVGLQQGAYCIDAACASSLYAIKLACEQLQTGRADLMLAGGINAADDLFLHMGFSALQALSPSGQSRPLHQAADGLIPAQGATLVVLKRLQDALSDKDHIYGVIRGIGLSNDGKQSGFLMPDKAGQVQAMQNAYANSALTPDDVSWVECHATGTPVGDGIEVQSMQEVFGVRADLDLGVIKANIGHTITASGGAALINVLNAFAVEQKPPAIYTIDNTRTELQTAGYQLFAQAKAWHLRHGKRVAAINSFGFGGNNAHLIVEQWQSEQKINYIAKNKATAKIAVIAIELMAAHASNKDEFIQAFVQNTPQTSVQNDMQAGFIDDIELPIRDVNFPPKDLEQTLGQQLAILKVAMNALAQVVQIPQTTVGAFIGMQTDAESAHHGLRWRLPALFPDATRAWLKEAATAIGKPLDAAYVIGAMPNIVANRLNAQFDFKGPSFSVSAEQLSGVRALQIAQHALAQGEINMALVGAVDMCAEMVHAHASRHCLSPDEQMPGDAAVILVLKRLTDAKAQGENIVAVLDDQMDVDRIAMIDKSRINKLFGHAYAASGLLQVAADILLENQVCN